MNASKKLFSFNCGGAASVGFSAIVMALTILTSPAITPRENALAAIDETMPATIPAEVIADWKDQDFGGESGGAPDYADTAGAIAAQLPAEYAAKYTALKADLSGEQLYLLACHCRRVSRMKKHQADLENILFTRHHNFGGVRIGYHDNAVTAYSDACWSSKSAICFLNLKNYYSAFTEIYTRTDAVVRDPCVSFDGKKVLVALSGDRKGTGYKIFEMDISDPLHPGLPKQLTTDPGVGVTVADFEPCYLPNGDIMFTSTRNFGFAADEPMPSTNMFLMNGEGKYMRQVGFDQAFTFYPVIMDDGTVLYTRWEFNDRSLINSMGLFYMYPDGSHQTEWFGNQNSWPYTFLHGRPIPGTNNNKVIAVGGGYHGPYCGELLIINRNKGTNGAQSISMIAPKRATEPQVMKSDISMGDADFRWAYPLPLDENDFLVSWRRSEMANGSQGGMGSSFDGKFRLYFMNIDAKRELLAWADQSVSQPVLMKAREELPPKIVVQANYSDSMGEFTMQNVYYGEGMKGIASGAKSLRVIALHYRTFGTDGVCSAMGNAPSGAFAAAIFCPVSQYGCSWEAKEVLGEAPIFPDGSAAFKVPARVPVYFQVIDSNGYAMASMRSWSTLMPGEKFACVGCHEDKITSPPPAGAGQAGTAKQLTRPLGIENKPFDYTTMVQPIFEKNCVSCHISGHSSGFDLSGTKAKSSGRSVPTSYCSLLKGIGVKSSNNAVNICYIFQQPQQQPPYSFGSSQSGIMTTALNGTNTSMNKLLSQTEKNIISCWIDLACPAVGEYGTGVSSPTIDRQFGILQKLKDIDRQNTKAMVAATAVDHDGKGENAGLPVTQQLSIGYMPTKNTLVFKPHSKGKLLLVDVRGRVIYRSKIVNGIADGNLTVSLPTPLGRGIYFAGFEGVNGISRVKISVTE
jgi:hypothetical protein